MAGVKDAATGESLEVSTVLLVVTVCRGEAETNGSLGVNEADDAFLTLEADLVVVIFSSYAGALTIRLPLLVKSRVSSGEKADSLVAGVA